MEAFQASRSELIVDFILFMHHAFKAGNLSPGNRKWLTSESFVAVSVAVLGEAVSVIPSMKYAAETSVSGLTD